MIPLVRHHVEINTTKLRLPLDIVSHADRPIGFDKEQRFVRRLLAICEMYDIEIVSGERASTRITLMRHGKEMLAYVHTLTSTKMHRTHTAGRLVSLALRTALIHQKALWAGTEWETQHRADLADLLNRKPIMKKGRP